MKKTVRAAVLTGRIPLDVCTAFAKMDDVAALRLWFASDTLSTPSSTAAALRYALDLDIAAIDRMIAAQLDAILHHPKFQALEASWRGLGWLVGQIETGPGDRVVVQVLNATWRAIELDMTRASDTGQSQLFFKIHESRYGQAGGEPFGLLVADHAVRHNWTDDYRADDTAVLEHLMEIGARAFAPIIVGAHPRLLAADHFGELGPVGNPAACFAGPEYGRWNRLRDSLDARFLAVALPRVLARPPWPDDGTRGDGFRYRERARTIDDRLWMNAAYPFAAVVARAVANYGWPADIRGADSGRVGGGLVTRPPMERHTLSPTLALPRLPLEIVFGDHQERALTEAGLMPLGALPFGEELLFGVVRALYRPPRLMGPASQAAAANHLVGTQLNATLCAARFAHFLKIRARDAIGRAPTADAIQFELRTWLSGFVNRNPQAGPDLRAKHPLYEADVEVTERLDKPGYFSCKISLQPYLQLDDVNAKFAFETEIAAAAA